MLTETDIRLHLDSLTKPPGSLGRLEDLATRLCLIQQTLTPATSPRRLVLFAADHGVVAEGVSAWPATVTSLMVQNIRAGGAASSVLSRSTGTDLRVIDVGTLGPPLADSRCAGPTFPGMDRKVRAGSRNLAREPALTVDEFEQAVAVGREQAHAAVADRMAVVVAGEMGIGNTTPASCLTCLLADATVEEAVGRGAGADDETLARKRTVVAQAVPEARRKLAVNPVEAIAAVSGLEIAAMAGFLAAAAQQGLTVVLDGFVTTSAALIANHLWPGTGRVLIAAHQSAEPGHQIALRKLGLAPLLETWQMRLGEGTGALVILPLLDMARYITTEMAQLSSLGLGGH